MATAYVQALEKKISELAGIPLDAIRKNQWQNLSDESADIAASTNFINSIVVKKSADAMPAEVNPLIQKTFDLIQRELNQAPGSASLPNLPYGYDALLPHMSADILDVHHKKHHQGYINNVNAAFTKLTAAKNANDNAAINALAAGILFNGGSHLNHSIFWTNMKPNATETAPEPTGTLMAQIEKDFGSFADFKSQFSSQTAAVKGSGWGWLAWDKKNEKLGVYTTGNQDTVEIVHGAIPVLTCDVWEHAYYLQYKNMRPAFIANWFKLINWDNVQQRFDAAK